MSKIQSFIAKFKAIDPNDEIPTLTNDQFHALHEVRNHTDELIPPLQRLEYSMHPFVSFLIIPIFAFANAGISIAVDLDQLLSNNVAIGVALGLLVGKIVGIVGFTLLLVRLKVVSFPVGMNVKNLVGLGFLASIGFTMSLFITSLAFSGEEYMLQAKIGIFTASLIGGIIGYMILDRVKKVD